MVLSRLIHDKLFLITVGAIIMAVMFKLIIHDPIFLYIALAVAMMGISKYALDLLTAIIPTPNNL